MHFLVVYDIAHARRLSRVAKILRDYGQRVQKSKFEIDVSEAGYWQLLARIAAVIEPTEDGVKYVPLCERCRTKTEIIGLGHFVDPDHEFVVL